jgi:NAD(P)H-dependent FMN reductase
MNFIGIVGTNASFSYNRKLLWYMKKHFQGEANIEIQEITDIPLFNEDIKEIPTRVREIAHAIEEADGVIFSTPEYDHSITAGLKSLIEWLSWGDLHPLTNTPVMIVGVSLGNMGTVFAQENLRQILSSPGLDAFVLPSNQFLLGRAAASFNDKGELTDERTVGWLEHCFSNFRDYTWTLRTMRHAGVDRTSGASAPSETKWLEKGDGWEIKDVSLLPRTDTDTGSSQNIETETLEIGPAAGVAVMDKGDGWWIEVVELTDATTGASKHGIVAEAKGQPDSSTGASKH